jgi:hypothetical protein
MPTSEHDFFKDLSSQNIDAYPFEHILVDNFLTENQLEKLQDDLKELENSAPQKVFESEFGKKREWKIFPERLKSLKLFVDHMASERLIQEIRELFKLENDLKIYPDLSYDGGGYVISPPNSYLSNHADFNNSKNIKKFRSLNILFYLNPENIISGGSLHLLDAESKTVEKVISPRLNRLLLFKTDDISFHGVSRNLNNFYRRSFNFYYYTDVPLSQNQSNTPHKTIWMDFSHDPDHDH